MRIGQHQDILSCIKAKKCEQTLADFQACPGKDHIEECITIRTVQLRDLGEVHW